MKVEAKDVVIIGDTSKYLNIYKKLKGLDSDKYNIMFAGNPDWPEVATGSLKMATMTGPVSQRIINAEKREMLEFNERMNNSSDAVIELSMKFDSDSFSSLRAWNKVSSSLGTALGKKSHKKRSKFDQLLDSSNSRKGFR